MVYTQPLNDVIDDAVDENDDKTITTEKPKNDNKQKNS